MTLTSFLAAMTVASTTIATPTDQIFFDQYEGYYFVINEIITDSPNGDAVEFYNPTFGSADMTGWSFTDSDPTHRYTFPAGSRISGHAYVGVSGFSFGLGSSDAVVLYTPDMIAIDSFSWTQQPVVNGSYSRCPDGFGAFVSVGPSSLGAVNICQSRGWRGGGNRICAKNGYSFAILEDERGRDTVKNTVTGLG